MNGHPDQDAVAVNRDPAHAWCGIVALCRNDNVSQINVAGISRRRAILRADARLEALEARNVDAEKLAGLVLTMFHTSAFTMQDFREEVERLARELAPKENE